MNVKDMSTILVSLIIGILMVVTVMVPIIESSETMVVSTENNVNGTYAMVHQKELDDLVIEIGNSSVVVNGEVVADNPYRSFVASDGFIFRSNGNECYGADSINIRRIQTTSITITISDGAFTYSDNGVEYSGDISFLILPDPDGNLGFFQNVSIYATTNTPVYYVSTGGYHADPVGASPCHFFEVVNGEVTRSLSTMVYSGFGSDGATAYEGDYTLEGIYSEGLDETNGKYGSGSLLWTPPSGETEVNAPYIIAPIEYQYISENDGVVRTMLEVLPIFAVIGLILGSFVMFRWRT